MQAVELSYVERNGILYPDIQISNDAEADKRPVGKYGMMWLRFMKEYHYDRYVELLMNGELMQIAHKVNDESHEQIELMLRGSNGYVRHMANEGQVIREFVFVIR